MRFPTVTISAALLLAACGTIETGGAGTTTNGEPVAGRLSLDQATNVFNVDVSSPKGWSCKGSFQKSNNNLRTKTLPLTCNDGKAGTLILTANQFQGQIVGSFTLSSGESGQVTFGHT